MMAVSPSNVLRTIAAIFVDVVRGIPLMIVNFAFIFWGIPNLIESITGHQSQSMILGATIALSLNGGAYIAEIVRGGIEAVPSGQMEASRSLGYFYNTTMRKGYLATGCKINASKLYQISLSSQRYDYRVGYRTCRTFPNR